ncbi:MAG: CocE/NonD family hydrolase [Alphaproteobacteria bacterium]|nr:CocE/NonD family hydrolase [Alphaproteobacteria bacterium]
MRHVVPLLLALSATGCLKSPDALRKGAGLPDFDHDPGERFDVMVPMRDHVELFTRVHLPEGEGPFPVVFTRVPYAMAPVLDQRCKLLVRYGFACAWQTTRGQGKSGGTWTPFVNEREDGIDALAWLVGRPWDDGHVALIGESYLAATQWAVADVLPPQVKTILPSWFGVEPYEAAYDHGLFRHDIATAWTTLMPERGMRFFSGGRYHKALSVRPRSDLDKAATGLVVPWYRAWQAHPDPADPWWHQGANETMYRSPENTRVPVLSMGGWSDVFLGAQLETWGRLATVDESTLVLGPWNHLGQVASDVDLPGVSDAGTTDASGAQLRRVLDWLDHHLKGTPLVGPKGKVVSYVTGTGTWATYDSWPPPTTPLALYPTRGPAEACVAPLARAPSAEDVAVTYTYDPADPTPSLGGAGSLAGVLPFFRGTVPGLRDQKGLCAKRADMIGFQTTPLEAPLHIAGPVHATLSVSTDVAETGLNVRIVERTADGQDLHVREGNTVLTLRDGTGVRQPYTPGERVAVEITTWPVEHQFAAGSRVLVEIASASFPKVEASANTTTRWDLETTPVVAHTTVHLGGTVVTLPVVTVPTPAAATFEPGAETP